MLFIVADVVDVPLSFKARFWRSAILYALIGCENDDWQDEELHRLLTEH